MTITQINIDQLVPNTQNVRKHNNTQIRELAKTINTYGVIRPVIVDENNVILCGHGLYEALKLNGASTVDCQVLSGLTDKQKKKLMLADNKVYDLGTNDYDMIDAILKEFGEEGDFDVPGYDGEILEDLYGIKSIEEDARSIANTEPPRLTVEESKTPTIEPRIIQPSKNVQEAREAAVQRRIIVCPYCGETIEL